VGSVLTAGLGESGSGLDLGEAERMCGLRLAACRVGDFYFRRQRGVSDICGGYNNQVDDV
jgi:hypothetical protein